MKLASEIAVKVGSIQYGQDKDAAWLALAEVIISTKLEPARDALRGLLDKSDVNDGNYAEHEAAEQALAMLSGEEHGTS